jgi:hypothetical protein
MNQKYTIFYFLQILFLGQGLTCFLQAKSIPILPLNDDTGEAIPVLSLSEFEKLEGEKEEKIVTKKPIRVQSLQKKRKMQPQRPLVVKKRPVDQRKAAQVEKKQVSPYFDLTSTDQGDDRSKIQKETGHGPLQLSDVWKEMMQQDFDHKTKYLSAIIHQGEENEQEKNDFIDRFQKNKEWVSASLQATSTVVDPQFDALMQKKDRLDVLVRSQKQADSLIQRISVVKEIPAHLMSKIRLAVLYALNDVIVTTEKIPTKSQIDTVVEEKIREYGTFKEKVKQENEPVAVLNVELAQEVQRLKKVIAEQADLYKNDYDVLEKALTEKEIEYKTTHDQLKKIGIELDEMKKRLKSAEVKGSIEEQARKEVAFTAKKKIDHITNKNSELTSALDQAEKEKFEAEKALRKALQDYKEVTELVSLLQHETKGLVDQNRKLEISLEQTEKERSSLELEKKYVQRQYDRLTKEIADLQKQLIVQKESVQRMRISLENASHEKRYAFSQIETIKKIQQNYETTEKALTERLKSLQKRLGNSEEQTQALAEIVVNIQKEHGLTLHHIQDLEEIRSDNEAHRKVLQDEIGRLHEEQVSHRIKSEKLKSLLKQDDISKKRKKQAKKELAALKKEEDDLEADVAMLQEIYESAETQDESLGAMLQELKSYIFDQDAELVAIQKALHEHKALLAEDTKISFEEKNIIALKRKNRALKNRLAALEAKLHAKKASTMESYFLKPLPQAVADKKIEQEEAEKKPKKQLTRDAVEALLQEESEKEMQNEIEKSEKKDLDEDHAFKDVKKVIDEDVSFKKAEKEEKRVPEEDQAFVEIEKKKNEPKSSIEEIKGSIKPEQRSNQKEKAAKPAIAPKPPMPITPPTPVLPSRSPMPMTPPVGLLPESGLKQPPFLPNKEEMQEVVNSIKDSIAQNPEEFEEFIKNVPQPTEEQMEKLQSEIAAMSPEERAHFDEFMQSFVSSFVGDEK